MLGIKNFLQDFRTMPGYGLVFFDEDQKFYYANDQAYEYFSFLDKKDQNSRGMKDFIDYMFDHAMECDAALEREIGKYFSPSNQEGFKEIIQWTQDRYCIAEIQKNKQGRYILILSDVSHIKKREELYLQLNSFNYELSKAVEAATNGIIVANPALAGSPVVFSNKAFCEFIHEKHDNIIGRGFVDIFQGLIDENAQNALSQAVKDKTKVDIEVKIDKKGAARWFNLKLTPVSEKGGQTQLFIAVLTETTALRIREAEFFRAQKLESLGQLAGGVAHDFNNVLSIIDGYSIMAARKTKAESPVSEYLEKIQKATRRGADLTGQMLVFSRHKISSETVIDLAGVMEEQKILMKPLIDASINFHLEIDDQNLFIETTPDSLAQILMNLTINARDAMPEGGDLTVKATKCRYEDLPESAAEKLRDLKNARFVRFCVTDTGTGMDKKTRDKMFEPFFTTKDPGKGTGLGLSMVYGLVNQMNGWIDVRSAPEQGTAICIYLPLSNKVVTLKKIEAEDDIETISLKGYTALVCDDEPDILHILTDILTDLGLEVIEASNGDEALLKQDDYPGRIDLLLTDVVMPELDGVALAEMLQELRPEIETIFISGYPDKGNRAGIELPEEARFLSKPVEYEALARLLIEILANKTGRALLTKQGKLAQWHAGKGSG